MSLTLFKKIGRLPSWFAGEVITYLDHKHLGRLHFLTVVSIAKTCSLDIFKIPIVTIFGPNESKKIVVCDVTHIITIASYMKFSDHDLKYKIIWPDAKYYQELEKRKPGRSTHI